MIMGAVECSVSIELRWSGLDGMTGVARRAGVPDVL